MDTSTKLRLLGGSAIADREGWPQRVKGLPGARTPGVFPVQLPGGRTMPILSTLMTNACSYSCAYCPLRAGREMPRASFAPEELATTFAQMARKGLVQGLFLTSAIPGSPVAMADRMLAVADILRKRHRYRGYIHLKILPGAEASQLERAAELADRLSLNLEAATPQGLTAIAPEKKWDELSGVLRRLGSLAKKETEKRGEREKDSRPDRQPGGLAPGGVRAGVTTQFIVGPTGESDREVLERATSLEKEGLIRHAHFSGFVPVAGTPLDGHAAAPPAREHRLYQADYLLRLYPFEPGELPFDNQGNLPQERDPKLAWALDHPERFPLDLARASREEMLRVPGIGPLTARRIVERRAQGGLRSLARRGLVPARARPFLLLGGKRLARKLPGQPELPGEQLHLLQGDGEEKPGPIATHIPPCAFR